jgi:hypothetical protein
MEATREMGTSNPVPIIAEGPISDRGEVLRLFREAYGSESDNVLDTALPSTKPFVALFHRDIDERLHVVKRGFDFENGRPVRFTLSTRFSSPTGNRNCF